MAISYLATKTIKQDPYTLSLDLNLMGRVLSIKQQKFDENAKKIQGNINALSNTDIIKDVDRQYLNEKVNNIVSSVNSIGGVDLGDINISNKIDSLGQDVYNDEKIINAISSTKSIRALQNGYQAYKTNPKLNKLYSQSNYDYDMQHVNAYISDNNVGSKYNGPSSPTPYVEFKESLRKAVSAVKANYQETITSNGTFMFNKETKEFVTPERIMQIAADTLTEDQRLQISRDGWHSYRNLDSNTILQKAQSVNDFKLSSKIAQLQQYTDSYLASSHDPIAKQNYETLINKQKAEIEALKQASSPDLLISKFKKDPEAFKQEVYFNEIYRGLASTYAYTKTKQDVVSNTAAMFNVRMQQSERFHQDDMVNKERAYNIDLEKLKIEAAKSGMILDENGKVIKDPNSKVNPDGSVYSTYFPNNEEKDKMSEEKLTSNNNELINTNTKLFQDFLTGYAQANPQIKKVIQSSQSGSGIVSSIKGQSYFEGLNKQAGLQPDDFNIRPGTPQWSDAIKNSGLSEEELYLMKGFYDNYQSLSTTGKTIDGSKLPNNFTGIVEQMQLNNLQIESNNKKIDFVTKQIAQDSGITEEALKDYNFYKSIQEKNPKSVIPNIDKRTKNYYDIKNKKGIEESKAKYYEQIDNTPVYQIPIDNNKDMSKKLLISTIYSNRGDFSGKSGELYEAKDVEIIGSGLTGNTEKPYAVWANFSRKDGNDTILERKKILITQQEALQLGIKPSKYPQIDYSVNLLGETKPLNLSADNVNKNIKDRKNPISGSFVIYRVNPNDRNTFESDAYFVDSNGNKIADVPRAKGKTPAETYANIKQYLNALEQYGITYDDMIKRAMNQ